MGPKAMNFIGIDLAWGPVNNSGIAVLDTDGVLVHVAAARTDDDILDTVSHYLQQGPSVVAIDAPLIVTNPTGMRPAEKALTHDFGVFHAGAYPAALDKFPAPRGTRLTQTLDLDVDPRSQSPRRAIEVYPHPATVSLFSLGRTFKYKRRKNRAVEYRRSEFMKYLDALERLSAAPVPMDLTANDDWHRLRRQVKQARRPIDLDRAEDPVDAVMCAYVALYAERQPQDVTIYGDFPANGYILTPTLPPGLTPLHLVAAPSFSPAATPTSAPPPAIAAQRERCTHLLTGIITAWSDIDTDAYELSSHPDGEKAMTTIMNSLAHVSETLDHAERDLRAIADQLHSARSHGDLRNYRDDE